MTSERPKAQGKRKRKKMNPLNWRREQQLALIIAAIIGLMLGEFSGFSLAMANDLACGCFGMDIAHLVDL
jgi:hypothetical protein